MRLQIRGVPRHPGQIFTIEPNQSGALLGRMEGDKNLGLTVPIPHIEQAGQGEPATTCLSRRHLRFDYQGDTWYVTLLGKQKTLLDDRELTTDQPQPLPPQASLRCGEVTLSVSRDDDRFATRAIPGVRPGPDPLRNPFETMAIRPATSGMERPVGVRPPGPDVLKPISADSLAAQARTMADQLRSELDRITAAARDVQQRRSQAEQFRDEARVALAGIRQATSLQQAQAAAERVRDAAQRARKACDQAMTTAETVRRGVERARDIERSIKSLSADTERAVSLLPANDPSGRILRSQTSQAEDEAQRRMAEIEDMNQRAEREREQVQAAERAAKEVEEDAMTQASRREAEFRRKDRVIVHIKRLAMIGLVLVSAILLGLLLGKLLENGSPDPLGEGQSLLGAKPQQRLQFGQVADHALQVAVHLDVHRRVDQAMGDERHALQRVQELGVAALPVDL